MTNHHAQARTLLKEIEQQQRYSIISPHGLQTGHEVDEETFIHVIAAALLAVEQRVWEEAAVYLDTEAKRFDHLDDGEAHMIRAFAAWCLAQAKEAAQGREKDES